MGRAGVVGGEGQISLSSWFEVDFFAALSVMSQVWFIEVNFVRAFVASVLVCEFVAATFFLVRIDTVVCVIVVSLSFVSVIAEAGAGFSVAVCFVGINFFGAFLLGILAVEFGATMLFVV